MTNLKETPQVRGTIVASSIEWMRSAYGEKLFDETISHLSPEDRAIFSRKVLSSGWYPLPLWERFLDARDRAVKDLLGEDPVSFNAKAIRGTGGWLIQRIYRFILSWLEPPTALARMPLLMSKILPQVKVAILRNESGLFVAQFSGPRSIHSYLRRYYVPNGVIYLLELVGAKESFAEISLERKTEESFLCELSVSYRLQ